MDQIVDKYVLDLSDFESGLGKVIGGYEGLNKQAKEAAQQNPFKKQADDLLKFNNQLRTGGQLFLKSKEGPAALKAEINRLSAELIKYTATQAKATNPKDWKQTQEEIKKTKARIDELNERLGLIPKATPSIAGGFSKIGNAIQGAFAATGILYLIGVVVDFGKKLIDITGTSEKYQNQFTRIFEGNAGAAKGYLSTLQTIADLTNFTFDTLADNVAKLASRGIIPTKKELLGLGDVANFINKDFGQLNEAILDANNPERWKELGFIVKTQGDKMTLSYGDFSKTVDNTVKGAYSAIEAFSQLKKVQGSTEEAGLTLSGRMSTLGDTFSKLFRTIGFDSKETLNGAIDLITKFVETGISLFRGLSPVIHTLGRAFSSIGDAISGVIGTYHNFDTETEKAATFTQTLGYNLQTYLILPLAEFTLVVAGVIEGFNQIVITGELVAAKLSGDKSLSAALSRQLDESKKRYAEIREEYLKDKNLRAEGLDVYVRKDNHAKLRQERRDRLNEEETADFKSKKEKDKPPVKKENKAAEKAAQKEAEEAEKERKDLVNSRIKLQDELRKLQDDYEKQRVNDLDKNSAEYIELKKKLDLKELEQVRAHLIEMGQELTGYYVKNTKTGKRTKVKNLDYKLPQSTENQFQAQRDSIESGSQVSQFDAAEARSREAFERQQFLEKANRTREQAELELELRKQLLAKDTELTRQAGESEIDYENRKNKALLQLRIDYYQKLLKLAQADPSQKDQVQGLVEQIAAAKKDINEIDKKGKTQPTSLFQLLGLSFKDEKGNDITDEVEKQVNRAADTIISTARSVLDEQIAADQTRIDSIDKQLEAKQHEVDTETELAKAGLANNLSVKRQEQAALQVERKKAVDAQRRDQKIQLEINAVLQASELALAVAKIFRADAGVPVIGLIAAGIEVTALLLAFGATIGKIGSLPKYHEGDEVTTETARRRSTTGSKKPNEIDIRAEVGEGVIRKESFQPNKTLLSRLNKLGRGVRGSDFSTLLDGTGVVLPESVMKADLLLINQVSQATGSGPDRELHKRVDTLTERMDILIEETRKGNKTDSQTLPDGRRLITDERGNRHSVKFT